MYGVIKVGRGLCLLRFKTTENCTREVGRVAKAEGESVDYNYGSP